MGAKTKAPSTSNMEPLKPEFLTGRHDDRAGISSSGPVYNQGVRIPILAFEWTLRRLLIALLLSSLAEAPIQAGTQENKSRKSPPPAQLKEEAEDYFQRWMNEDVVYVISKEERAVFESLTTPEEKEQFIEQFWFQRDPDPRSVANEFKEEHYRRIAYANERFASGFPGWMNDRGRIYIIHGPPDEIEAHPSGGRYDRPLQEGGGTTVAHPFEVWRYRHIEGLGSDVILEFVDPSWSGEYRLALNPDEKDALLNVAGAGNTIAEMIQRDESLEGTTFTSPGNANLRSFRSRDTAYDRYETFTKIRHAKPLKHRDLKRLVEIDVTYQDLPFAHRVDYFGLDETRALVPVSVEIHDRELTFGEEEHGRRARMAVYGMVTNLSNRIVDEFEADLVSDYRARTARSVYQRVLVLERKGRYKLDLIIKDLNSGRVGVRRLVLIPPPHQAELSVSSILLSNRITRLESAPDRNAMFVLGDLHIRPSLDKVFRPSENLNFYLQVYNVALDQTAMRPSLRVAYRVAKGGHPVAQVIDIMGKSIQYLSEQRVVLVLPISLQSFEPGSYEITVTVKDLIQEREVRVSEAFELAAEAGG